MDTGGAINYCGGGGGGWPRRDYGNPIVESDLGPLNRWRDELIYSEKFIDSVTCGRILSELNSFWLKINSTKIRCC